MHTYDAIRLSEPYIIEVHPYTSGHHEKFKGYFWRASWGYPYRDANNVPLGVGSVKGETDSDARQKARAAVDRLRARDSSEASFREVY